MAFSRGGKEKKIQRIQREGRGRGKEPKGSYLEGGRKSPSLSGRGEKSLQGEKKTGEEALLLSFNRKRRWGKGGKGSKTTFPQGFSAEEGKERILLLREKEGKQTEET